MAVDKINYRNYKWYMNAILDRPAVGTKVTVVRAVVPSEIVNDAVASGWRKTRNVSFWLPKEPNLVEIEKCETVGSFSN